MEQHQKLFWQVFLKGEVIRVIEGDDKYDAISAVSRVTGWPMSSLSARYDSETTRAFAAA